MTTIWMLGVIVASVCLTLAAYLADRTMQLARRPKRWVWAGAMVASVSMAVISLWQSAGSRPPILSLVVGTLSQLQVPKSVLGTSVVFITRLPWIHSMSTVSSQLLLTIWCTTSGLAIVLLFSLQGWIGMRRRQWTAGIVESLPVLVTPNLGPAVVGVFKPVVVLPAWLLGASEQARRVIMQHEREHVTAGDSKLLMLAALLVAVMPWNVILWWQYRRLHAAIENDCDARVLARGNDVRQYSEILMQVAARAIPVPQMSLGFCLQHSHLRDRIHAMTVRSYAMHRAQRAVFGALSGVVSFGAVGVFVVGGMVSSFVAPDVTWSLGIHGEPVATVHFKPPIFLQFHSTAVTPHVSGEEKDQLVLGKEKIQFVANITTLSTDSVALTIADPK